MSTTPPPPPEPYPTQPPGYPAPASQGPPPEQPRSVRTAVRLMWTGAALGVLGLLVSLATLGGLKDRVADQLRETDASITQSEIDAVYAISLAGAFVGGLVSVGLWSWMAWKNGQGRPWARVVATVLAGLNLVSIPFTLYSARSEPLSLVLALVNALLAVVILVLLWRRESSAFYAASAARR